MTLRLRCLSYDHGWIWQQSFPPKAQLDAAIDLDKLASEHEFADGAIMNIVRFVSLRALEAGDHRITPALLREGICREFAKEGKNQLTGNPRHRASRRPPSETPLTDAGS